MELSYWDILALVAKAVAARVDPLKARVDAISDELAGAATDTVVATGVAATPSVQATPLPDDDTGPELLPFDVKFDLDAEGMTIYAPDGCILVDGQPAAIEGSEEGYVPLSDLEEDEDASSQIVYAHVTKAAGGASWTATFDCNEYTGNDEDRFDFAVVRFLGWPRKERLCASVVSLSTGQGGSGGGAEPDNISIDDDGSNGTLEIKSWAAVNRPESPTTVAEDLVADVPPGDQLVVRDANGTLKYKGVGTLTFPPHVPGNFEPAFGANDSFSIGPGFVPAGRLFYYVSQPTLDSGVLSWVTGLVYIEVTHTVDSAGNPQAPSFVFKQTNNPGIFVNASDKTVSRIPLYQLNTKVMEMDFRSCMSLTMREG